MSPPSWGLFHELSPAQAACPSLTCHWALLLRQRPGATPAHGPHPSLAGSHAPFRVTHAFPMVRPTHLPVRTRMVLHQRKRFKLFQLHLQRPRFSVETWGSMACSLCFESFPFPRFHQTILWSLPRAETQRGCLFRLSRRCSGPGHAFAGASGQIGTQALLRLCWRVGFHRLDARGIKTSVVTLRIAPRCHKRATSTCPSVYV